MSAYDPTQVYKIPGRLILGPTDLTQPYPCGAGTPVGIVAKCRFTRTGLVAEGASEARGLDGVAHFRGRERGLFQAVLQQWDPTVNNLLWARSAGTIGYQGADVLALPQPGLSLTPGLVATQSPLLFLADSPDQPSLLVYAPIFRLDLKTDLDTVLDKPLEEAFVVGVGVDSSGRTIAFDLAQNLSL